MPSPALLPLVRHGETSANVEGVWHGSIDTALPERGHAQAARVSMPILLTRPCIEACLHRLRRLELAVLEGLNGASKDTGLTLTAFPVQ